MSPREEKRRSIHTRHADHGKWKERLRVEEEEDTTRRQSGVQAYKSERAFACAPPCSPHLIMHDRCGQWSRLTAHELLMRVVSAGHSAVESRRGAPVDVRLWTGVTRVLTKQGAGERSPTCVVATLVGTRVHDDSSA
jgi:hypothetical protein